MNSQQRLLHFGAALRRAWPSSLALVSSHGQPRAPARGSVHHPLLFCVHKLEPLWRAALRSG